MWLDGKLIVDDASLHDPNPQTATVALDERASLPGQGRVPQGRVRIKLVWQPARKDPLVEATSAAQKADVVVAVVGITSKLEGEEMKVDRARIPRRRPHQPQSSG